MAAAASSQAPGPSSSSRLTVAERRKMVNKAIFLSA